MAAYKKKLIEVALPLDEINAASAREKSIRHGHPSTLHLWWARRPLATARAVIWSSLVDDPSAHPEQFPTKEEQDVERERLFDILRKLVVWENSNNPEVLDAAKAEIRRSMGDDPIELLDPFAGGGAIPLEAQRLGLVAHAQDLNPVAVNINKAMIEIPPRFAGNPAVNPRSRSCSAIGDWSGNTGLAADVEYYGAWMRDEAFRRIGHLYPKVKAPGMGLDNDEATVIAWIWARTVKCPNPLCGHEAPLVRSFDLSKKKGKEAHIEPHCDHGELSFEVKAGKATQDGTMIRNKGARCMHCGEPMDLAYIRAASGAGKMGARLMAVVAEGVRGRLYLPWDKAQIRAAEVEKPEDHPSGKICDNPRWFSPPAYGFDEFDKLFTNRQLTALTAFSGLVAEAQELAYKNALQAGMLDDGVSLDGGGNGALAYGQAIGVYLAFVVDKMTDYHSSICSWHISREIPRNTFGRQAIPMTWDYAEVNPFSDSSGSLGNMTDWISKAILDFPKDSKFGDAIQFDAQSDNGRRGLVISTDPPYYDNIGYADLSDYFYVWLRQSIRHTYPELFSTMLVPKTEELVATPYRDNRGKDGAKRFFEDGMSQALRCIAAESRDDVPVTVYYAFKQSEAETDDSGSSSSASTGWETMLSAIINASFSITGTWPMRTEMSNRSIASGTNALASSIVLVCRKRDPQAPVCTRREFISALRRELPDALAKLQSSNIAPVDLAQSAIGPGIAVYSRYAEVLEADGSPMGVRAALQTINRELDSFMSGGDADVDRHTRLAIALFEQAQWGEMPFGDADQLARAKNDSVKALVEAGAVESHGGRVRLLAREELDSEYVGQTAWVATQCLAQAFKVGGIEGCAKVAAGLDLRACEEARSLAYRLFSIADRRGWTQEASAYNELIVSWNDIARAASELRAARPVQQTLF